MNCHSMKMYHIKKNMFGNVNLVESDSEIKFVSKNILTIILDYNVSQEKFKEEIIKVCEYYFIKDPSIKKDSDKYLIKVYRLLFLKKKEKKTAAKKQIIKYVTENEKLFFIDLKDQLSPLFEKILNYPQIESKFCKKVYQNTLILKNELNFITDAKILKKVEIKIDYKNLISEVAGELDLKFHFLTDVLKVTSKLKTSILDPKNEPSNKFLFLSLETKTELKSFLENRRICAKNRKNTFKERKLKSKIIDHE